MSRAKLGLAFLGRLFLGDDWQLTAVPLAALAVTALLHQHGLASWWLVPVTVALALTGSIRRVIRGQGALAMNAERPTPKAIGRPTP
jgi:hypothetical protein